MPSITPFSIFMEKKKPQGGGSGADDLTLVKAAAWAWYQHGSGSEGKTMCESDVTRTRRAPGPSRYKLEAMGLMKENTMELGSETPSPIRTDKSLLDDYEVESISKHFDYLIESSSKRFYGFEIDNLDHDQRSMSSMDSDQTSGMKQKKDKKKKIFLRGFWPRHSVVCATREDVDTRALVRCGSGNSRKGRFR
ncbi:unnamed protein product [Dovyalis caffra]|uniref:Uncharacterized protein n=1 Tax=Dovyalis caffra TaxID=77055 RepID=A0AAV1RTX6_9ROSI|nr:unnamed protein product [Dovyalis caffra]